MTTTGFAVHLAGVHKTYRPGNAAPITAVDNASLDLAAGDTAALTGPSGSGKSTLLHLLGAIDAPDSGTIEVGGTDITGLGRGRLAAYRATIGFVFQKFHLLPALSARDNVIAPALPRRRHLSFDPATRAQQLLEAVGLGDQVPRPALSAIGRPAAARRDRPRPDHATRPAPGRRADRKP